MCLGLPRGPLPVSPRRLKIGVHQFAFGAKSQVQRDDATVITQVVAADIVKFIKENRADTEFFSLMTSALPSEIYFVPPQKLRELRVVTDAIWDENWSFEISQNNDAYLRIWQQSVFGENKLLLFCINKRFSGSALIQAPENSVGPFTVGLFLDGKLNAIPEELIVIKPKMEGKYMTSSFVLETNLASRLLTAQTIGAAIQPRGKDIFFGFQIKTAKGRDKLSKLIQGCR